MIEVDRLGRFVGVVVWLVVVSLGTEAAAAQEPEGRVELTVVTEEGEPVEAARISLDGLEAFSNSEGRAALSLPAGRHTLRVESFGYVAWEDEVEVPAGGIVTMTVVLRRGALELEGVVVTSTRLDRRIEDEPLRVEVIGREEVEEKILMTPGDIAMLLNETAGLRVQPTAPSLGGASVRIQGLSGRYTLILSDGLPLYGGQSGALGPLQIPPMDLGQVEVIKGVASALFGATALGGVVNLVSRRPRPVRELLLNGSTLGGGDAILWMADDPEGPWGWSLLAGLHGQQKVDPDEDAWADLPSYQRAVVRPRLEWNDGKGSRVLATVGGMTEDRRGGTVEDGLTPTGASFAEELSTRRADLGVLGRFHLSSGRFFSWRGSGSFQRHEHRFGSVLEKDRHVTGFFEASLSGITGAHNWVLGAAIQSDSYKAENVTGFDYTHTVPAVFAQDEVGLTSWLVVSASGRVDKHNKYGTFFSPRFSVLLRGDPWTIRASAGGGYFAPTPFTEEVESVGLTRLAPLPDDLEAERGRSASVDVGRQVGPVELNVTLFGSDVRDPVMVERSPEGTLVMFSGEEPIRTWGTEILGRYHQEPFHITGTYVFLRATEQVDGVRQEIPLTPRHTAGLVAAWEDEDWGRVGAELYLTGEQQLEDDPYRETSRSYTILGFLAEHKLTPNLRVFLNAENVLDARQTRWTPLIRPSRAPDGRWTTDVWAPLEGRAFNAGVRISF